jgi:hypothetical protein
MQKRHPQKRHIYKGLRVLLFLKSICVEMGIFLITQRFNTKIMKFVKIRFTETEICLSCRKFLFVVKVVFS